MNLGLKATRRGVFEALLGLGATRMLAASLDVSAWRTYASVEEQWIRERHELMLRHWPHCLNAAELDLELKLAELRRRAYVFQHLVARDPTRLRGGIWQLAWIPFTAQESIALGATNSEFRRNEEIIRRLSQKLKQHPEYEEFRKAQAHVWRSPDYKEIHRRYTGRMQELQQTYSAGF